MSVNKCLFKKTCFECGSKVDFLVDSKCEKCFKLKSPPIVEVKPINICYCNSCKKLIYGNKYNDPKLIEKDIYGLVKKNLVIDEHYDLNELNIVNLVIDGSKVKFEIEVDCSLKK